MHRKIRFILALLTLTFSLGASAQSLGAGTTNIRYVSKSGQYANDGKSWKNAKANIQDAINDLVDNGLTGEVWVAKGTYTPTESTESSGGSTLYMSFKIPAGISVLGGFAGTETDKNQRAVTTMKSIGSFYSNYTVLSGDLSSAAKFTWDKTKEQWSTAFYGNCYHVVTFATKGFDDETGRANGNGGGYKSAMLEGCVIEHGNATNSDITGRPHNAYGGGVYMVEGAYLKNCWIRECVATRNGGGVYMDGGGYMEHCFTSNCQAVGIGTSFGYGGGVCMDGPDKYESATQTMIQRQCGIQGCVGRMGGGLAILANDLRDGTNANNKYKIACTAMLVANNTATTEGGGVYMNKGGAITQMTVVRNKCNGAGVSINGMTTGRSAGIYCRDNAIVANAVLWGGECEANSDIQYAASRSGNSKDLRPYVMYTSLTKSDNTDWSGVIKNNVTKLSEYNTSADGKANASEGYPMFTHPTPNAGYVHTQQQHQFFIDLDGTDYAASAADKDGNAITDLKAYDFQPTSRSALNHRGINVVDIDRYGQTPAFEVDYDITGKQLNPRPTLGGYTTTSTTIIPQVTTSGSTTEVNFYVDPNEESGKEYDDIGSSWNQPIRFLADALSFISEDQAKASPVYCQSGRTINVYVKQGTVNNTNSQLVGLRVRESGFNIPSNTNIKGGYSSELTDTNLDKRNPNAYVTTITGEVMGEYATNVAHLLRFQVTENSTVDGFQVRYANSRSTELLTGTLYTEGAAISMYNAKNVKVLNCGIVGNTGSAGAAAKLIGSAGIYFENCIVHNNESREYDADGNVKSNTGNIVVDATSDATFCHCDFLRNVGSAIDSYGTTKVYNSVFYGNMREPLEDTRNNADKAVVAVRLLNGGTFEGNHNLFDEASKAFIAGNSSLDDTNEAILTYEYSETSNTYPRFINPTKNAGVNESGDATYYGRTVSFMPHNNNPMVNRASTVDNTGAKNTDHSTWGTDMTGLVTRDYGGLPDIGAIENHEVISTDESDKSYSDGQKAYGTVKYVRDYNTYTYNKDGSVASTTPDTSITHEDGTARDGISWENAINGNATTYDANGTNGLQYAVNEAKKAMDFKAARDTSYYEKYMNWGVGIDSLKTKHTYYDLAADSKQCEVWVGAGIYTNTAGFQVANHVKVYGAFPKTGTPGMNERHPQLTTGITLSTENQKLTVSDYETILQTNTSTSHSEAQDVSVLRHPEECRVTTADSKDVPADRVVYEGAEWNGFTIRYGYKKGCGGRNGGAGVSLYENVTLTNCVIRENELYGGSAGRGGGLYVDGSSIINCYIINNVGSVTDWKNGMYGGGMYMIKGTIYNSVIAGNSITSTSYPYGAGAFFESADFFNNTVVNNTGGPTLGIYTASAADAHLTLYNSIIIAGTNALSWRQNNSVELKFTNCFLQSTTGHTAQNGSGTTNLTTTNCLNNIGSGYPASTCNPFATDYTTACDSLDFRIKQKATYNAVNAGTQDIIIGNDTITIPSFDMDYTDRVQDCEIDMGAYEYNGAYNIEPDVTTNKTDEEAIFYVTPEGRGNASATDPDNAACASKLQKVLDAAGRYKYNNPTKRVIVKVANSNSLAKAGSYFKYYACRTTDANNDDVRIWSIIVPRGVEVWGGYTDTFTSSADNGFYTKDSSGTITDNRDIVGNPTYFDSYYYNSSEKADAYTYHVVSFTDKVFDGDGNAYAVGDADNVGTATSTYTDGGTYLSMKSQVGTDRAVIDGIFITGGNADAKTASSDVNINQYGGAAIVTDYAHVRNCIVRNNKGTYGGALALTHGALVSGCLIDQNTADYGGAIYVFGHGKTLSDGTKIDSKAGEGEKMDAKMAHVYTSTIVNNTANQQGGGILFGQDDDDTNVRVNSSVIWQNNSSNMANVSGLYNPTKTDDAISTQEFFPFSYCAVQNIRMSGVNNLSLGNLNKAGARFRDSSEDKTGGSQTTLAKEDETVSDFTKFDSFGYYALTDYSILVRTGMPTTDYTALVTNSGLSQTDFTKVDRLVSTSKNRSYIEMGARALDKVVSNGQLMLRLFVAQPTDIDMDAAETMMQMKADASKGSVEEYYSQEGSSFAYPMQSLQDALDYIVAKRSLNDEKTGLVEEGANNLPFEICMGRGTFYPSRTTTGVYGNSPANTFAIPEGVSIYGGFAVGSQDKENSFFGRYNKKKTLTEYSSTIASNVETVVASEADTTVTLMSKYYIDQCSIDEMLPRRQSNDNNGNNIIEPWEFENQTILSGDAENQTTSGVYHVVSVFADQNVVGMLPKVMTSHAAANDTYHTQAYADYITKFGNGSFDYEEGQYITLDGLQITGGSARSYVEGSTELPDKYTFYCGGGLLVDGNRYCDGFNKYTGSYTDADFSKVVDQHGGYIGTAAYRDIPVNIVNCKFTDNEAGLGGAVYSNGTLNLYKSTFEHNKAVSGAETLKDASSSDREVQYPGNGGAVVCTHQLGAYNVIFANNEALNEKYLDDSGNPSITPSLYQNIENKGTNQMHAGSGGAVYIGPYGFFHLMNCDIVRNQANLYPAVFTLNPNPDFTNGRNEGIGLTNKWRPSSVYYNQIINTVVWGNDINSAMSKAHDSNELFKFNARLICNYVLGDQAVEITGTHYTSPSFTDSEGLPKNQAELDSLNTKEHSLYGEVAWFSAYEEGRGTTPLNDADFRNNQYSPFIYARDLVHQAGQSQEPKVDSYQNCNVLLSSENFDLEGPNFINPSSDPGYDGYNEASDWSPARLTNLTDNGSGQISQTVKLVNEKYVSTFNNFDAAPSRSIYSGNTSDIYTSETTADLKTEGVYTTTRVLYGYETHRSYMPAGEQEYMTSASTGQKLYRISYDPNPTHDQTYIDIGVYEYPHTELQYTTAGDEVDILWVSATEKPDNGLPDGSAWSQPTSDFQRAIETLLASRNGHRKEIRLMDGTFTPIYNIDSHLAFYIDTKYLNKSVTMTAKKKDENGNVTEWNTNLGVKSLTIKGGYSNDIENVHDPNHYPAVIRQQARSNATSDRWDHLFYIADATQRYGYEPTPGYNDDNGFGSYKKNSDGTTYDTTVSLIPIQIDGVTIVNNQARSGQNGAAIFYDDVADNITSPTAANISVNTYYTTDSENRTAADKSEGNEPTLYYERTVDKYYTDATYQTEAAAGETTAFATYKYVENPNNKIIISKSKIMNSGSYHNGGSYTPDYTTSAVYIGKNGGNALLYNDVMHSNLGNPLVSAVPTTIVNNTYALNHGHVDLNGDNSQSSDTGINQYGQDNDDDAPMLAPNKPRRASTKATHSQIFNTVFWRNNDNGNQFILPDFVSVQKSGDIFAYNAFTGGNTTVSDYQGDFIPNNNYNVGLSDENGDVINGPNFTDPKVDATTTAEIEARDFTLQPSLRLLNKGNNGLYNDKVVDADYNETSDYNIYDLAWHTTTRMDAAGDARFVYDIDLGAFEYQNDLNRIIYVNPNVGTSGLGNSWASPVAYGNLQAAIDLAAVYHVNNVSEEAYVFVKGAGQSSSGLHLDETITLRDGVSVYGSLLSTRTEDCPHTDKTIDNKNVRTYTDTDIADYIATVTAERAGIASPGANKTTISGIKTSTATTFNNKNGAHIVALIDGFDVTAKNANNTTGTVTAPVIDVQPVNSDGRVVLRNLIVHDNELSSVYDKDIAVINNALIYEALFRDNKVSATGHVLHLGTNGYGVNLTVEGSTHGADGTSEYNGHEYTDADNHKDNIYNSLVNYSGEAATENTLSGHNYLVSDKNLNYQLTEKSVHIDQCGTANPLEGIDNLKWAIDYATDRDLLGNLRLLNGVSSDNKIDRGAFETWRVDNDVVCTSAGNFYPHQGSVVYIMQGKNLAMEPYADTANGTVTTQTAGTSFLPAYLLMQDGASFYGEGNTVGVGYLGVERNVRAGGAMISMPFTMQYEGTDAATNGVGTPSYDASGVLSVASVTPVDAYKYNGVARSAWNSKFYDTSSAYWTALDDVKTDANNGVLLDIKTTGDYRFTAQGDANDMEKYVYTEAPGEIKKTVLLTQHDDRESTAGAADFTEKEDMGWNCFGLPYLVSDYSTMATETLSGDSHYNMNIPHTLWLYYDGKNYPRKDDDAVNGDGGFFSVSSWTADDWHLATGDNPRIWLGEGIFTQTSAVADTESLDFYRPVYTASTPAKGTAFTDEDGTTTVRRNARYYEGVEELDDVKGDITVRVRGHVVYVYGLEGGESIVIYDTAGRVYNMAKASCETYSTAVPANGVYVIKVDNQSVKAVVR